MGLWNRMPARLSPVDQFDRTERMRLDFESKLAVWRTTWVATPAEMCQVLLNRVAMQATLAWTSETEAPDSAYPEDVQKRVAEFITYLSNRFDPPPALVIALLALAARGIVEKVMTQESPIRDQGVQE